MSFLFITLNYSLDANRGKPNKESIKVPLPFNPEKDPKISGKIILISTIDSSDHDIISVGVECSYKYKSPCLQKPLSLNSRAQIYRIDSLEEEAKRDVLKVTQCQLLSDNEDSDYKHDSAKQLHSFKFDMKQELKLETKQLSIASKTEKPAQVVSKPLDTKGGLFAVGDIYDFRSEDSRKYFAKLHDSLSLHTQKSD